MPPLKDSLKGTALRNLKETREAASSQSEDKKSNPNVIGSERDYSRDLVQKTLLDISAARKDKAISRERVLELEAQLEDADDRHKMKLSAIGKELEDSKFIAKERKALINEKGADVLEEMDIVSKSDWNQFRRGKDFLNTDLNRRERLVDLVRGALPNVKKRLEDQRDRIRTECRKELVQCALDKKTILSMGDIDAIMEAFSEKSLSMAKNEKEKMEWMRDSEKNVIPRYLKEAERYGTKVMGLLQKAKNNNAISEENFSEWRERMKTGNWKSSKEFVEKKFETYVKNWIQVANERQEMVKDPRIKTLKESGIVSEEELAIFISEKDFLNTHYTKRVHLVGIIKTAVRAQKASPKVLELLTQARSQLQAAANKGVLAKEKVGVWMDRISKFKHDPERIKNFLNGKGKDPLSTLVKRWTVVRGRFDKVEERKKKDGPPPTFHFVKLEVFLYWDFEKRETYVEQAEQRFEAYKNDPDEFLHIRHAFDTKDWDEAEELLTKAERFPTAIYSLKHQQTLQSLRRYFDAHRPKEENKGPDTMTDAETTLHSMREALGQISSHSTQNRVLRALTDFGEDGGETLRALFTMYYNHKWCREHGYSSDEIDANLRKDSKERTYASIERGGVDHGHVDYDLTTDTSVLKVRENADINAAQAWHVDESTDNGQLMERVHRVRNTRAVWYWTRIMEKNVPYSVVQHWIDDVFPVLKRGKRKLDALGVNFTLSGSPQMKTGKRIPSPSRN